MKNSRLLLVGFKVTSFNAVTKVCNVTVIMGVDGELVRKNFQGVGVSSLLSYKFSNDLENYEIGREYVSSNVSADWMENPMQLIRYGTRENPKFLLSCVNERSPKKFYGENPIDGSVIVTYVNRYHSSKYYTRYRDYLTTV